MGATGVAGVILSAVATTLRDRYLAAQQLDMSQELAQRIADTAARLNVTVAAIAAATRPDDADIETSSRMRELQAEVDAFADDEGETPEYTEEMKAKIEAAKKKIARKEKSELKNVRNLFEC